MSISDGLDRHLFLSGDGKDLVCERRNGRRGYYLPPEWAFSFVDNKIEVNFVICTFNWPVNIYICCQGKGKNSRNKSTIIIINLSPLVLFSCSEKVNWLLSLKIFPHYKRRSTILL